MLLRDELPTKGLAMRKPLDKRTKAGKLAALALEHMVEQSVLPQEQFLEEYSSEVHLVESIALMIAAALQKPEKVKKEPGVSDDAKTWIEYLQLNCKSTILLEPWNWAWGSQLTKQLRKFDWTDTDIADVAAYLNAGGWRGPVPTFDLVIRYLPQLVARAREGSNSTDVANTVKML